tara:strand:- start:128 stop:1498 length:1371 start_codon:yes stop_codon:yes gene_type:complete
MSDSSQRNLFGTDGIRGRANVYPMTPEVALQLGRAIAHVFRGDDVRPRIVIGKDTRLSNYMFETALQAGICSMGVDAVQLGVLPTPGIAFMTTGMRASAGVVISASHNPYEDNGIKFFAADGFKLPDSVEHRLEQLLENGELDSRRATGTAVGRAYRVADAGGRYCVYLKSTFPKNLRLSGLKIVVDCANGAGYKVGPEVLYELGADVVTTGDKPDGTNINDGVGALYPDKLAVLVKEHGADLGIALDGDADRLILVDANGHVVDGDQTLALLACDMLERDELNHRTLVATVMSNLGLERAMRSMGAQLLRTQVGDRYVVEKMRAEGYNLGGEQSGHIVALNHSTTGDGLISALQVLRIMVERGRPLSELADIMERVPQVLKGVKVQSKPPLSSLPTVSRLITGIEEELGDKGRILVRYSGTEKKCRVMLEGDNLTQIEGYANDVVGAIQKEIGHG